MRRSAFRLAAAIVMIAAVGNAAQGGDNPAKPADRITIKKMDDRCRVLIGGELFTDYIFRGHEKPILYPVIGPCGIGMTRNYPMKSDVPGEAHDHPHHESLWFAHQPINGVNFWTLQGKHGKCVQDKLLAVESDGNQGLIRTTNNWVSDKDAVVFTDTRTITFRALGSARAIDWEITLEASHGPVTIGDSKEGTMAIRTHPALRLENDPSQGVTSANGQAVNSEGVRGKDVWGKRADWIDYYGAIDGKVVGIAILDHPQNPRHPTHWMAREYGFIGANPFGLNAFEGKPKGTGNMTIPAGEKVTFRYRFLFHEADAQKANIAQQYADYAKSTEARQAKG